MGGGVAGRPLFNRGFLWYFGMNLAGMVLINTPWGFLRSTSSFINHQQRAVAPSIIEVFKSRSLRFLPNFAPPRTCLA